MKRTSEKRNASKRIAALVAALALVMGLLPLSAFAADGPRNYLSVSQGGSVSWAEHNPGGDARIGTVSPGQTIEFNSDYYEISAEAIDLVATPESGYMFFGWCTEWNSTNPTIVSTSSSYTWTLPTDSGVTLTAVFIDPSGQTLTPITGVAVNFTPPNAGQAASSGEASQYASVPASGHCTVSYIEWYESLGAITPFTGEFEAGKTYYASVTLVPEAGYMFLQGGESGSGSSPTGLTVNGASAAYDYLMVTNMSDGTQWGDAIVSFTPTATTHTVTFDMGGHYGAVASQTVNSGEKATRPTAPATDDQASDYATTGLHFHGWYNKPVNQISSYTEFCYTPSNGGCIFDFNSPITQDATVYAAYWGVLTVETYDLTRARPDAGGSFDLGSYNSANTSNYRGVQTTAFFGLPEFLTAKPDSGYRFVGWSTSTSKDDVVRSDASYRYIFLGNTALYALFEQTPVYGYGMGVTEGGTATLQWEDGREETVMSAMNYAAEEDDVVTLSAVPADGYHFKGWYQATWNTTPGTDGYGFIDGNDGTLVSSDVTYSFTASASNDGSGLQAVFEKHALTKTEKVEPACTKAGAEAYWTCGECGKLFLDEAGTTETAEPTAIAALGHDWSTWTVVKEATETEDGSETRICARCSEVEVRTIPHLTVEYRNTEGDGAAWTSDSGEALTFVFKRNINDEVTFRHFVGVKVDGVDVDASNYTVVAGSAVVTLKASYLAGLSGGSHTVTAVFDDGTASADFTIQAKDEPAASETKEVVIIYPTPKTGDDVLPPAAAALLAACCGIVTVVAHRKMREPR